MAAASLSTSLSTPPPPYRRMSEADRTTSSSACDFSAYCCLGTIHLKTATFMICLGYLLVLAHVWHQLIPEWSVDPTKGQIDARLVTYVLVMAAVVVCALIGVHYENHVYIFPLVTMHFVCLAYTMLHLFFSSFGSSSGGQRCSLAISLSLLLKLRQ
uniref:Uncharacterized protein n=1 Tax=Plectus sambesii TaxID=2011161 RepID=A0A914WZR9_9BILA